jgi:DNA-binding transcriptional MerR regulator/effector-binding domain-containing protein
VSENLFSIGEFSQITGLPVKTLRFYHEEGLLAPSCIDDQTGYRYYAAAKIETARVIAALRELEFSLPEIAEILASVQTDGDLLGHLESQKHQLAIKAAHYRQLESRLDQIISHERQARVTMKNISTEVQEKQVDKLLIAAVRMTGCYGDCGKGFARIGRNFGRHICGPCLLLHHDREYKETDANFEACAPVRAKAAEKKVEGITVRELPAGKCVALVHRGPYEELGRSYEKILTYIKSKDYEIAMPTREIYLKGPGMIFKGNPQKYLTEIQMLVKT